MGCPLAGVTPPTLRYDTGSLQRIVALSPTEDRADALAARVNRLLDHLQRHHRQVDSVLYTGGRYTAFVYEWAAPFHFPTRPPSYC